MPKYQIINMDSPYQWSYHTIHVHTHMGMLFGYTYKEHTQIGKYGESIIISNSTIEVPLGHLSR